ncbi:MAG: T9SS type A sorting domain-containing protein [Saprospiraceae bacterium]|nr:T9SS type A sorting domain-containing protein [Saprospiraceae bacterium]
MTYPNLYTYFTCLCLTLLSGSLGAQNFIYPGDINNNGQVEKTDFLYLGYAYNFVGPARIDQSTTFSELNIPVLWEEFFPDGMDTNFALADCDGNGWINWQDILVIINNYSEAHDNVVPIEFVPSVNDFDPAINLEVDPSELQLLPGAQFQFPISLGGPDTPINNFLGIAFSVSYDTDVIKDIRLDFLPNSWLNADGNTFLFQDEPFGVSGKLDGVGVRYGQGNAIAVSGGGIFAELEVIIEDDLVGLLPWDSTSTIIYINEISMIGDDLMPIPVQTDSLEIMVYGVDAITSVSEIELEESIRVFPNPTDEMVVVQSPYPIQTIEVMNILGAQVSLLHIEGSQREEVYLPKGKQDQVYMLKITCDEGIVTQRVLQKHR